MFLDLSCCIVFSFANLTTCKGYQGERFGFDQSYYFFKQANEVVKANNLSDKIIVLHGRVEVSFIYWQI